MQKHKTFIIIFSGYNQRAVIAFLRTLRKNELQNYIIFASSSRDTILKTEYATHVESIRKKKELDLEEIKELIYFSQIKYRFKTFVIAPSTEVLNRFIIAHQTSFNNMGNINVLVDDVIYKSISDKKSFGDICKKKGIMVPKEIEFPHDWREPFVAKPIAYFDDKHSVYSPILIRTKEDYDAFNQKYPQSSFYYQQFVYGKSIYLLYYILKEENKNRKVFKFSQENLMQQSNGKSILAAIPSAYHEKDISKKFETILLELGYYGFVMVELKVCEKEEYMIEANPRFWGPSQLFVDAGMNFFEVFLKEYGFLDKEMYKWDADMDAVYYWHGGTVPWYPGNYPVFYEDFKEKYIDEVLVLLKHDIYRRPDTSQLFLEYC